MTNISFVILHYNNIEDTYKCVDSIRNLKTNKDIKLHIIIVDNKSPDGSGNKLVNSYKNSNDIEVILSKENLGFSKGNNLGYARALKNKSDTIMIINNDIIFEDPDFILKYMEFRKDNECDVIAPDIIDPNGKHQNPLRISDVTISNQRKNLIKDQIYSVLLNIPLINYLAMWIYNWYEKRWLVKNYDKVLMKDKNFNKNDFIPFGAFIIFTGDWIKNEKKAFYSNTFMYGEEIILYKYLKEKKYSIGFCENLKVRHLCGKSTNKVSKNAIKKAKFKTKNNIIAYKEIIKTMKS